jgi:O-antigen ligase
LDWKYQLTVWVLVLFTAFLLVLAIYKSTVDNKTIFYGVVVSNILIVSYLVLLKDISLGIVIYLYSLTFLNHYWRFVIPGRWPDIDIPRMMFVFIWFVILLESAIGGRKLLPKSRLESVMLALLIAILAVMLTKGHIRIRQFLNGYAIPFAMFVVAKNSFRTYKDVQRFLLWFVVPLSFYFPINAFFEYYHLDRLVFPTYILNPQIAGAEILWGQRAMGAFLQPVVTGTVMVSIYVLSLYRLSRMQGRLPQLMRVFITLVTPVAVFFTLTRSVYLGFFSALMVLMIFSRKQRKLALVVVLVAILGVMANWSRVTTSERSEGGVAGESTALARLVLADVSLKMFLDRPFVGVGFTRFMEYARPYVGTVRTTLLGYREHWIGKNLNQHNQLLSILTEIGLIGFIPLVLIYIFLFRYLARARNTASDNYDRELVVAITAVWVAYMVNIQFIEPRFFEFMNVFPFILAGIVVGGYQRAMLKQSPG